MVSESAFLPKSSKYEIYIISPLPTTYINQPPKYPYLGQLLSLPGVCLPPSDVGDNTYLFLPPKDSQGGALELWGTLFSSSFLSSPTFLK